MKNTLVLVMCGLLVGCAAPSDLRKESPDFSAMSSAPVSDVASCIVEKWESGLPVNISVRPLRGDGTSIMILGGFQQPVVMVDVQKNGAGSRIEGFTNGVLTGPYIEDVRKCTS